MQFRRVPIKLHDCQVHGIGSGAELFIVEGDSASQAAAKARCQASQAVLPMQGKPLNAWKASRRSVEANELYAALIQSIGAGWDQSFRESDVRYDHISLLFDPDADGIHCGALTLMFFYRWMRPMLESGKIGLIRPPVFELRCNTTGDCIHAYSEDHYRKLCVALEEKQIQCSVQRFRGLASMNGATLHSTCIDPATRNRSVCTVQDAEAAIRVFTGTQVARAGAQAQNQQR
jgi:DNA gyrase subunit B/topoisomerase-4 subunit B